MIFLVGDDVEPDEVAQAAADVLRFFPEEHDASGPMLQPPASVSEDELNSGKFVLVHTSVANQLFAAMLGAHGDSYGGDPCDR